MRSVFFAARQRRIIYPALDRDLIAEAISTKRHYASVRGLSGISNNRIMDCLWTRVGGMFGRDLQQSIAGLNDQTPTAES